MEDQILHKLTSALSSPVSTETQAVYVLVQVRKLLDRRKESGLPDFPYLRFCSDWVVHIKLQGATAQKIIRDSQDLYQKSQAGTFTRGGEGVLSGALYPGTSSRGTASPQRRFRSAHHERCYLELVS